MFGVFLCFPRAEVSPVIDTEGGATAQVRDIGTWPAWGGTEGKKEVVFLAITPLALRVDLMHHKTPCETQKIQLFLWAAFLWHSFSLVPWNHGAVVHLPTHASGPLQFTACYPSYLCTRTASWTVWYLPVPPALAHSIGARLPPRSPPSPPREGNLEA